MALREHIEYQIVAGTLALCRILPERAIYGLFAGFARLMHRMAGKRRRLARRNAELAFPEWSLAERKALIRRAYLHFAESMAFNLLILIGRISNEQLLGMVETEGWERLHPPQSETDPGLLIISGHLGNWELLPQYAALRLQAPVQVVARQGNNPLIEERIVRPLRERFGCGVFYKKNALMRIVKAARKGGICGLMIDQKLSLRQGGATIDFFGHPAPTTISPAQLQIRYGVAVQPAFIIRMARNRYRLIVAPPVEWNDNEKPVEEQVAELTRLHQHRLETMIRRYPEQWFWMHNRWSLPGA